MPRFEFIINLIITVICVGIAISIINHVFFAGLKFTPVTDTLYAIKIGNKFLSDVSEDNVSPVFDFTDEISTYFEIVESSEDELKIIYNDSWTLVISANDSNTLGFYPLAGLTNTIKTNKLHSVFYSENSPLRLNSNDDLVKTIYCLASSIKFISKETLIPLLRNRTNLRNPQIKGLFKKNHSTETFREHLRPMLLNPVRKGFNVEAVEKNNLTPVNQASSVIECINGESNSPLKKLKHAVTNIF